MDAGGLGASIVPPIVPYEWVPSTFTISSVPDRVPRKRNHLYSLEIIMWKNIIKIEIHIRRMIRWWGRKRLKRRHLVLLSSFHTTSHLYDKVLGSGSTSRCSHRSLYSTITKPIHTIRVYPGGKKRSLMYQLLSARQSFISSSSSCDSSAIDISTHAAA